MSDFKVGDYVFDGSMGPLVVYRVLTEVAVHDGERSGWNVDAAKLRLATPDEIKAHKNRRSASLKEQIDKLNRELEQLNEN